ncbi:MAG: DPP IV N-terminal domain-containing protein [Planctomycetes bacterium]|nr:DPP IV N-terminal domain-containing protein [Planctomycetota bacterium]
MMNARQIATAGLAMLLAGCSLQYNGAWGQKDDKTRKAIAAAQAEAAAKSAATPAKTDASAAAPAKPEVSGTAVEEGWARGPQASRDLTTGVPISATPKQSTSADNRTAAAPAVAQPVVAQPAPQAAPADRVQFATPSEPAMGSDDSPAPVTTAVQREQREQMRGMSLFGQVSDPQPQRSSPLDSPENVRQVTFTGEGSDFDPSIDPTGQWVVFASTQHRQTSDLYIKRVDGSAVTQLTDDPGNDAMPVFSPDGKRVAFTSDRSGTWNIYIVDINGGQPVQVTGEPTHNLHPSFSRDGKQLVYCTYGAQSGQWELVVVDIERPTLKRYIGTGLNPTWSPVEDKIVFQRARERGTRWFSVWTLDVVNGEGLHPTEIAASSNAAVITPRWSPDGAHVVFSTVVDPAADQNHRPAQADVWIASADGSNRVNLTRSSSFTNLQPVWSRDGAIYFVSNRSKGGIENIYSVRPDRAIQNAVQAAAGGAWVEPTPKAQASAAEPTKTEAVKTEPVKSETAAAKSAPAEEQKQNPAQAEGPAQQSTPHDAAVMVEPDAAH